MSAKIRLSLVVVLVVSMFTSICSAGVFAAGVPYAAASAPAVSNRIVFGSGVAEMAENAVTAEFAVHGYYNTTVADAKTKTEAFVLKTFSNAAKPTLYLDSKGTAATGIWVKYSSGKLSLTFKNAPYKNASYYVKMVDGNITTALTPVYVVAYSDKYLKGNSVTFFNLEDDGNKATNDTFTLPLSNDIKANQNNVSSVAPGGSQSIFSAADFKDLEDSSAEDKAAVNWYINSGITNGGDSWDEFTADRDYYAIGDGYLRLEAVHFLFRLFILDNEVKSGASGVGFTDVNPGIITSFVSLFPTSGTSFYRGDSVIDPKNNYTGKNAGSRAFGVSYAINMGDLLNYIYNAVTDDRANLSSEGKTLKSGLLSKPHGTRAQKAEAVGGVLKLGPEAANLEATVNKFNAVKILYKLKGTNRGIMVYPDGTGDAAGFGYNVTAGGTYDNGYYASANTLVEKDTTLTGKTFASSDKEIQKAGLWVKNNAKVTLIDSTILSRSAQNEKYRWGGGAGLLVTGKDTVVRMINTNGRINVNGTGGTMSGAAFTGMGGTLYYQNAQVYSGGQHTSNSCWGGILIYDNSNIFGGGRTFSTDHFGGNLVYKASISDKRSGGMGGAYVLDETSSLLSVNSYFAGGGQFEINGMAQAYYLNSKIDNSAAFTFQNNTSMSTDVGTVTLVNTEVNLSGSTLANALKGGRGILTLVDSNVTAAKTGNVFSVYGKNLFMHGSLKVNLTNSKIPAGNVFVAQGDTLVINTDARSSVDLTLDASKPTTWNNSMFKLSYTYNNLGNIIVNGMETGLDENGRLLNEANASMTPGSMGAYDVVYSIGGSKITYKNLPVGVGKDNKVFSFKDMSPHDWYYYYVAYGVDKGIISGTSATAFSPDASVTRGMIITMLWRMADKPLMRTSAGYTDLKEEWYRDAANWAAANKIVDSAAGGRFGPSDAITRSELVTLIYRFNYYKGLVGNEQDASILKPYTDAGTLTGDALAAMRWAVGEELIKGRTATTLVPQGKVTRVEVTSILIRYTRFIKS